MTPEPAAVLQGISTAAALIFILTLPIRLWMVRNSTRGVRGIPSWKGRFKLVSIPIFPIFKTQNLSLGLTTPVGSGTMAFGSTVPIPG